jgi:hypothetical protein
VRVALPDAGWGRGPATLPLILADELGADWAGRCARPAPTTLANPMKGFQATSAA